MKASACKPVLDQFDKKPAFEAGFFVCCATFVEGTGPFDSGCSHPTCRRRLVMSYSDFAVGAGGGLGVGIMIGVSMNNLPVGVAIGIALGAALGGVWAQHRRNDK